MKTEFFKKRIKEKAKKRWYDLITNFLVKREDCPILKKFEIEEEGIKLGLLGDNFDTNDELGKIDIAEIKEEMIKQYEKEETENILSELDGIAHLFKQEDTSNMPF